MNQETTAQIINGTIDPNWVLTLLVGVTAVLLIRILNRIEKRLEVHDQKLESQAGKIAEHDTEIEVIKTKIQRI